MKVKVTIGFEIAEHEVLNYLHDIGDLGACSRELTKEDYESYCEYMYSQGLGCEVEFV